MSLEGSREGLLGVLRPEGTGGALRATAGHVESRVTCNEIALRLKSPSPPSPLPISRETTNSQA